jgi:hypothetical protein
MRVLIAGVLLASCAYHPSSFESDLQRFPGWRATAGCLDVAVDRRADAGGHVVLAYAFGNRCDTPVIVDLAGATVIGRGPNGTRALAAYDPRGEVAARWLDGRAVGREVLAYEAGASLADVCVDVSSMAHVEGSQWLCFDSQPMTQGGRDARLGDDVVLARDAR